jgi:hypothetical protein
VELLTQRAPLAENRLSMSALRQKQTSSGPSATSAPRPQADIGTWHVHCAEPPARSHVSSMLLVTGVLICSITSAVTLVDSARNSSACILISSNCFPQ